MKLEKRKSSGREKDEASIKQLAQLREKLGSEHVGTARRAAYNLSWLQEDGLDILKEALLSDMPRRTKCAAVYGLRKTRGRMKKKAEEVLIKGSRYSNRTTAEVCQNALLILWKKTEDKEISTAKKTRNEKFEIKGIPRKGRLKRAQEKTKRHRNRFIR